MKKLSLSALAAVGVLAGITGANAADLGGNCCADLEERIAELEATTARKGNRKVSLTISGWVSQQVSVWDDGTERNAYISDIGVTLNSNFKMSGSAKITPDLSAGYLLHIEAESNSSIAYNADTSRAGSGVKVLQSFWFLKSETLGKVSVGLQSSAVDNAALLPDGSGSLIFANYIMFDIGGFTARLNGVKNTGQPTFGAFATCGISNGASLGMDCDGVPNNVIRYDTPTFAGFSASASWGEDDIWGVSGRYAGEFSGFKLAAAVGYMDSTDDNGAAPSFAASSRARGGLQAAALQAGAYIQHVPTGLFVYGAYGQDYNDVTGATFGGAQQIDGSNYYVKAGIRQKWTPLGASVLYGEYGVNDDKMTNAMWVNGVSSTQLTQWGVGFVQEIDAAAMSLFLNYRHYSADATCRAGFAGCAGTGTLAGSNSFDDAQLVKAGAIINF